MHFIRKTEAFAKLFFLVSVTGLVMYAILAFYSFHFSNSLSGTQEPYKRFPYINVESKENLRNNSELRYILLWTIPDFTEYKFGEGQAPFTKAGCLYSNCFITTSKDVLSEDYTNFEAVIFDINVVRLWPKKYMPKKRSGMQKYVFYSMEASDYSPVCNILADNYFNWTWSYKLYSDIVSPFISVKTLEGLPVAPHIKATWRSAASVINDTSIQNLKSKSKPVVWIMKKCQSRIDRMVFVNKLKLALKKHFLSLDIFGCDHKVCPYEDCETIIRRDYYFFLSYEHSNAEDYVSEDVLSAYENNAVPIVLGNAEYNQKHPVQNSWEICVINSRTASMASSSITSLLCSPVFKKTQRFLEVFYEKSLFVIVRGALVQHIATLTSDVFRFLPYGSYINARFMVIDKLAALIYYNIHNPESYHSYFRWKNLYRITKANKHDGICDLCAALNNYEFTVKTQYENLREWWYKEPLSDRCFPRGTLKETVLLSYLNKTKRGEKP